MYMKNIVKSYMKSRVPRFQMVVSAPSGNQVGVSVAAEPGLRLRVPAC